MKFRIEVASERAFIVYFEAELGAKLGDFMTLFCQQLQALPLIPNDVKLDLIPSYTSVLVQFPILLTDHFAVKAWVKEALSQASSRFKATAPQGNDQVTVSDDIELGNVRKSNIVELPVYYDTEVGPDLIRVAEHNNLTVEQVIELHQAQIYRVFAIGFAPGFGYLGEVSEKIAMPRLATPRSVVPKGAVAIADRQTAVYPAESPGGWNLIGRCPVAMFDPKQTPHMPFAVGDQVQFFAIDKSEFLRLGGHLA